MADPALSWADAQRKLREAVAADGPPAGVRCLYRLFFKVGSQVPPALAFILLPWLLRGGEEGTYMALYVDLLRGDRLPDLVLSVGDQDTAHLHRAGHAVVFGVPEPLGALGIVVGDEIVWPAYPPRRGRRYDPRWSPRVADDGR